MLWLRSSIFHVLPASSERYNAFKGGTASMKAYTTSGLEGATATATRPHGFTGSPVPAGLRSVQVAPPSVVLNSRSPMETLLRIHDSPVPTQITLGFLGSIVMAPIDCTGSLSNTALNVVPPLVDFHTPPEAAPAYTVSRVPSCTAATAAMRPLMAAEPMLRAPNPE